MSITSLLDRYGENASILAGGTDLLVLMRSRAIVPNCIVDITGVSELDYIKQGDSDALNIGALTTLRAVELSKSIREGYPLLYEAVSQMATTQVRYMGTVAGNICRASPSADTAPPLLVLDASVEIAGSKQNRVVPIADFFVAPGETVLKHNEMVTGVQIPKLEANTGTAFLRLTRVAADLTKVSAASAVTIKDGMCQKARIALGGVAPTPIRAKKTEEFLTGKKLDDEVIEKAASLVTEEISPISDVRSTSEYRMETSKLLVSRVLKLCKERA
jgi:carbon-monoxide dehydrogenase medium subunit